jgi:HSP20 family protein
MRLVHYTYPSFRSAAASCNRSPWGGLETEINRLFSNSQGDYGTAKAPAGFPVEVDEDQANAYIRAELPGVNRDDIKLEIVDGALTISATRKVPALATNSAPTVAGETAAPSFALSRAVTLGEEIATDKVSAAYENGVLTVTLPKREPVQPKKITVAVK